MELKPKYAVGVLARSQLEEAVALLTKVWVDMEPLIAWMDQAFEELNPFLLSMQQSALDPMLSTVAADSTTGDIVGMALNFELGLSKVIPRADPINALIDGLDNVYREHYATQHYEGKVMEVYGLGVADSAKGKGLGKAMIMEAVQNAKKAGYKWCVAAATNVYSARICENLGMTKVGTIKYDDFECVDADGAKPRPFRGMDGWYTELLNAKRPAGAKKLETTASHCELYEGKIDKMGG